MEIAETEFENSKRITDSTIIELEDHANEIMEKLTILQLENEDVKENDKSLIQNLRIS